MLQSSGDKYLIQIEDLLGRDRTDKIDQHDYFDLIFQYDFPSETIVRVI